MRIAPDTVTYSLDDDAGGRFVIDLNTGVVTTNALLDYEVSSSHSITVRATSTDGSFSTQVFTISLLDENDNPPVITAAQTFNVNEDAGVGTSLGFVAATDADTVGSLQGWTNTGGNTDGIFQIDALTGEITVADDTNLNFEATNQYTLTLTVGDGLNTSAPQTVTLDINDVNETPSLLSLSNTVVAEHTDTGAGFVIGTLSASDPDLGEVLTYTVVGGLDSDVFSVSGNALVINDGVLDFETQSSYDVRVRVTDSGGLSVEQTFTISVTDLNDAPVVGDDLLTTPEDTPLTFTVAALLGNDSDQDGDPLTATLASSPSNGFVVDNLDGTWTYVPDAHFFGSDTFDMQVDDGNGGLATATVQVDVTSVNDLPQIAVAPSFTVDEGNTAVGQVSTTDVENDQVTLRISGADSGRLQIDPQTGAITFAQTPDYENPQDADADGTYDVMVTATDSQGGATQTAIRITVADRNEAPTLTADTFSSNPTYTGLLGTISAADQDAGDTLTLTVTGGSAAPAFRVNPTTGDLTQDNPLSAGIYTLDVLATDSQGAQSTATMTITVVDDTNPLVENDIDLQTLEQSLEDVTAVDELDAVASTDPTEAADEVVEDARTQPQPETLIGNVPDIRFEIAISEITTIDEVRSLPENNNSNSALEATGERTHRTFDGTQQLFNSELDLNRVELSLPAGLLESLDELQREIDLAPPSDALSALAPPGAIITASVSLTAGFVTWLLRAGALAATALSTTPLWRQYDPIPILAEAEQDDDGDPLRF